MGRTCGEPDEIELNPMGVEFNGSLPHSIPQKYGNPNMTRLECMIAPAWMRANGLPRGTQHTEHTVSTVLEGAPTRVQGVGRKVKKSVEKPTCQCYLEGRDDKISK